MRSRNLLHSSKVSSFVNWAATVGWRELPHYPDKYEVLRLKRADGNGRTLVFFKRIRTDHVTAFGEGHDLVRQWFDERRDDE